MIEPDNSFSDEQKLVQAALAHVQAVFRGNGVKKDNIKILSHKVSRYAMNAGTYLELKPVMSERSAPGKIVSGALATSRDEAMRAVDATMRSAATDAAAKAQIANVLLQRPDQGFGLNRQVVPLDFLKRDFTWHESCHTCQGTSKAPCQKCQGRRLETCVKCSGRGLMPCPMCRATGLLQGNKCTRCHAQRYIPCDGCQRSGMMPCRTCNASGVMKCPTCAGHGWKSNIITLTAQALTYFEYEAKAIPKPAADAIETRAPQLAAEQRIKITGRIADDKENVLGASYEVNFPYGEIQFQIGKKDVKAFVFGFKSDVLEFPYLLDKMLAPAVEELQAAANDQGSVADKIQKSTRYRLIAQAFLKGSRLSIKKTAAYLMKTFDLGLSPDMAERISALADRTTAMITRKPRIYGLVAGLVIVAGMAAAYYLLPLRSAIAAHLPDQRFDIVLDLLPIALGSILTTISIQLAGAKAIRKALGHLIPAGQKNTLVPKTQSMGWWGFAGTIATCIAMMETAAQVKSSSPYWYEIVRNLFITMF